MAAFSNVFNATELKTLENGSSYNVILKTKWSMMLEWSVSSALTLSHLNALSHLPIFIAGCIEGWQFGHAVESFDVFDKSDAKKDID